jgi:hypothetical protein
MELRSPRAPDPVRGDLAERAASLRMEAEFLCVRADAVEEDAVRNAYLALAERWLALASGLDAALIATLVE